MELRQLNTFRTVATTLSFTRAAETLNYAQSSVSAQIQELEEEYGLPLFERLGRKVALTQAGQRLLVYAEKILDLAHEARSVVSNGDEPAGTLVITTPESVCTYLLPPVLECLREQYPRLELVFRPLIGVEGLERQLSEGAADAAVEIMEAQRFEQLILEPLCQVPIYVVARPDHRLARQQQIEISDFRNETLLLTERGCTYRAAFERILHQAGVRPATVMEFHSIEAIKQCVLGGMGVAVLPEMAVHSELLQGRLVRLSYPGQPTTLMTYLTWHKDKWQSPALQAFLRVTREMLTGNTVL